MRNRVPAVVLTATLVLGLTLLAVPTAAASGKTASAGTSGKVTTLAATLKGANEVPGPGDPDGRGLALVRTGRERVCFALAWTGIAPPIFAHIHAGAAGVAGPVVVPFFQPGANAASLPDTLSSVAGCVDVDRGLAGRIASNPRAFYVNIHTAEFPDGAIRGQLHRND